MFAAMALGMAPELQQAGSWADVSHVSLGVMQCLEIIRSVLDLSPPSLFSKTTLPMATSLDKLKATGTVVVSDSGDFDCEWPPRFSVDSENNTCNDP